MNVKLTWSRACSLALCLLAGAIWPLALQAQTVKPGPLVKGYRKMVKPAGARTIRMKTSALVASKDNFIVDGFERSDISPWYLYNEPSFGLTTYRKAAGSKSLYCAQAGSGAVAAPGPYPANCAGWITYGPLDLSSVESGSIAFKLWCKTAANDALYAGLSLDDVDYELLSWNGDSGGWIDGAVNLQEASFQETYLGKSRVYFSFYFESDGSGNAEGAYVDEVLGSVTGGATGNTVSGTITGPYGEKLPGVTLTLNNSGGYTYSNYNGTYSLRAASNGTFTITPKRPGYTFTPASRSVDLTSGNATANFTAARAVGDGKVKYWAVIVGIADYPGTANDLNYCDDDAQDVYNALLNCGWPAANMTLLKDSAATKAAIKAALDNMAAHADADDICLYFHSSHGTTGSDVAPVDEADDIDEMLCTYDISTGNIRDDELSVWMSKLKTYKYVVLLDTCFSGGMIKSASAFDFSGDITRTASSTGEIGTRDLDDLYSGVVVTAARQDEYSQETSAYHNAIMVYHAVTGITTGLADANQNGYVSAEEVAAYARPRALEDNPEQTLDLYDGCPGELEFAKLPTLVKTSVPARSATNVSRTANIDLTFRWAVNHTTAQKRVKIKDCAGRVIAGAFSWPAARTLRFNPTNTLKADETYTVLVTPGLKLTDGTFKYYSDTFTFRTAATTSAALALSGTAAVVSGGQASITVNLNSAADVEGVICNIAGRAIATLSSRALPAGVSSLSWNGLSGSGVKVPAGQYLVKLQARDADGNTASCVVPLRK